MELVPAMLRFEAELAAVEADLGLIPAGSAGAIRAACAGVRVEQAAIDASISAHASPVMAVLDAIRADLAAEERSHLHLGATSQDTVDTAAVLFSLERTVALLTGLDRLGSLCAALAAEHRDHVAVGRTLGRRARPTTFGLRAAGWLDGVVAARRALRRWRDERAAVQLGGAAGSLDVLGEAGVAVGDALAKRLGLAAARPWHGERARMVELAAALVLCGNASAKIASDVVLLGQDEVAEVAVAAPGGSSAMPGKRNPAAAVMSAAAARRLQAEASVVFGAVGVLERATGAWQAEIPALLAAIQLSLECVNRAAEALDGLQVDAARMLANAGDEAAPAAASVLVDRALADYAMEMNPHA